MFFSYQNLEISNLAWRFDTKIFRHVYYGETYITLTLCLFYKLIKIIVVYSLYKKSVIEHSLEYFYFCEVHALFFILQVPKSVTKMGKKHRAGFQRLKNDNRLYSVKTYCLVIKLSAKILYVVVKNFWSFYAEKISIIPKSANFRKFRPGSWFATHFSHTFAALCLMSISHTHRLDPVYLRLRLAS